MLLNYSVKIKSLNNKKIKILKNFIELKNNNKNFKKFIIIKSPFKYKKSREQYGLNYVTYIINLKTIQLNCKFFELFFFKFFWFSNKYLLKIKKKEIF
jgi:hypothetical protein